MTIQAFWALYVKYIISHHWISLQRYLLYPLLLYLSYIYSKSSSLHVTPFTLQMYSQPTTPSQMFLSLNLRWPQKHVSFECGETFSTVVPVYNKMTRYNTPVDIVKVLWHRSLLNQSSTWLVLDLHPCACVLLYVSRSIKTELHPEMPSRCITTVQIGA
jgi:hypothetical protein